MGLNPPSWAAGANLYPCWAARQTDSYRGREAELKEVEQDKYSYPSVSMLIHILLARLWVLERQTDRQITSLPAVRGKRRNRPSFYTTQARESAASGLSAAGERSCSSGVLNLFLAAKPFLAVKSQAEAPHVKQIKASAPRSLLVRAALPSPPRAAGGGQAVGRRAGRRVVLSGAWAQGTAGNAGLWEGPWLPTGSGLSLCGESPEGAW